MAKASRWLCKVHEVECSYGHPCYACKQEVRDPKSIESEKQHLQAERERNAKPRIEPEVKAREVKSLAESKK